MHALFPLVLCLALAIWLGHVVHCRRITYLTEATVSLMVGLFAGGGLLAYYEWWRGRHIPSSLVEFNTKIFFDVLLPPIIFNAGISVKKKNFFKNFTTLALFGVIGTFVTSGLIAAGSYQVLSSLGVGQHLVSDSLALGTIFSSTDSVATLQILDQDAAPVLYSLVFGEGVVNDATSIVLLRAVQKISRSSQLTGDTLAAIVLNFLRLFVLSLMLGVSVGLASARLIKRSFVQHSTDREVSLVALLGFLAYLIAEELQLSGIFSVFFCGITISHYTWHALSPSAKVVSVYLFRILSFTSELFMFLFAGFSMWSTTLWHQDLYTKGKILRTAGALAAALVVQVLVARGLTLLPLSLLANTWRPAGSKITWAQGTIIWWAGSMRGAVTVAMAFQNFASSGPKEGIDNQIIVVASNAAVIFITVVMGGVTSGLLRRLLPPADTMLPADTLATLPSLDSHAGISAPLLSNALQRHMHWNQRSPIYVAWHKLDEGWLRPLFGGRAPRAAGYRSPPPSPGRQIINAVMGPSILKRMGAAAESATRATGEGDDVAAEATAPAGASRAPPPPAPLSTTSSFVSSKSERRRGDGFRLWPVPVEQLASDAATDGGSGDGSTGVAAASTAAAPLARGLSARGLSPEALEMHPVTPAEELFHCEPGRMDSAMSQQLNWRDSSHYGEAAWLAAGAPSNSWDPQAGGLLGAADSEAPAMPPSLSRTSPFQDA